MSGQSYSLGNIDNSKMSTYHPPAAGSNVSNTHALMNTGGRSGASQGMPVYDSDAASADDMSVYEGVPVAGFDDSENPLGGNGTYEQQLLQHPCQAFNTAHFVVNYIVSLIINWGINVLIGYINCHNDDYVGLWKEPETDHPASTTIWVDFTVTIWIIAFLTYLLTTLTFRKEIRGLKTKPVPDEAFTHFPWTMFPLRMRNLCLKSLVFSLEVMFVGGLTTVLIMMGFCEAGWFRGDSASSCSLKNDEYWWIKGAFATFVAVFVYPVAYIGALNRKFLPQETWDEYVTKHQEKYLLSADAGTSDV